MEVKRGYKQTEVGIVPEEWEIKSLYMLADKIMIGIASAATHAYQNIKRGFLDDSDVLFIAEENEETYRNKRLKSGDLLTARTGYQSKSKGALYRLRISLKPRRIAGSFSSKQSQTVSTSKALSIERRLNG